MSLITRKIKAKDIGLPKWARKALKERGLKENEVEVFRKGISPDDTKINKSERSTVDYISTKAVDRDGDIVVPNGAILDHYRKNPVVLFGHNYNDLPIGKSLWIKKDEKGLISKTQYAKHQKAEDIFQYRSDGFPMAKSIGFIPLSVVEEADFDGLDLKALELTKEDLKGASRVYPEWLMLEYSDVPVPSNPEALQLAISKGVITMEEAKEASERKAFVVEIIEPEDFTELKALEVTKDTIDVPEVIKLEPEEEKEMLDERYGEDAIVVKISLDGNEVVEKTAEELYQKKAVEKIDYGEFHLPLIKSSKLKPVDGIDGFWNKDLDIANLEAPPSAVIYDIASKWLECEVKDIYAHSSGVPSAMGGNFLSGLEEAVKDFDLVAARNLMSNGSESPPTYKIIQLTSEKEKDFLVNGMEFYEKEGKRIIIDRYMSWFGLDVTAYSAFKDSTMSVKVFSDTKRWIKENNLLKGERFALSGEFIQKTDDTWDSLFLDSKNEKAVKDSVRLINKRGADLANRGLIYMGPPGTGKTLSGRIMMNTIDATFIWVSARDFSYSGAMGGIRYGFNLARELAPTVLFIEDIDNWLHGQATDLMKTEMDGIAKSTGVVTVLTSNYPEQLPPALIDRPGRFHDILNFSLPDATIRTKMLKSWAGEIQEKTVSKIIEDTVEFSGAHMYELVAFAKNISEEDEIDLDSALLFSLNKIKEQRELIQEIQKQPGEILRSGFAYIEPGATEAWTSVTTSGYSEEKAGRVLSKRTRVTISDALSGMEKATEALTELVENADSKDEEVVVETVIDENKSEKTITVKAEEKPTFKLIDVDENKLKSSIADAVTELLRNGKASVGDMVKESLDRRNGRIF